MLAVDMSWGRTQQVPVVSDQVRVQLLGLYQHHNLTAQRGEEQRFIPLYM